MNISVNILNGVSVNIYPQPKKKKTEAKVYDIYLKFNITRNGVPQYAAVISSGITAGVNDWDKHSKEMKGRNDRARLVNERLNQYMVSSKELLEELRSKGVEKPSDIKQEILTSIKTKITGKAPRGLTTSYRSRLLKYKLSVILQDCLNSKKLCKGRQEKYKRGVELLKEFYSGEEPLVSNIGDDDLKRFKLWYLNKYKVKDNTLTTYFSAINALFNYAVDEKIITTSPVPKGFAGSYKEVPKEILDEAEIMLILRLNDATLSKPQQVAKYCMLLQALLGLGFGDMRTLRRNNSKFDVQFQKWYLQKERNKTGHEFKVYHTSTAKFVYDKLRGLSGGTDTIFALYSTENALRMYKKVAEKAGITKKVGTYTFRHSYGVNFMDHDGRLEDLQVILGHKHISSTCVYGKISSKRLNDKIEQLERKSVIHQLHQI
jgi:site-specific recombinase XerD